MLPTPLLLLKKQKTSAKKSSSQSTTDCDFEQTQPYSEEKIKKRRKIRRTEDLSNLRRSSLAFDLQPISNVQGDQKCKMTKKSNKCYYLPKVEIDEKENICTNGWTIEGSQSSDDASLHTKSTNVEKEKKLRKKLKYVSNDTDDDDVEFSVKLKRKKIVKNKLYKVDDTNDQSNDNHRTIINSGSVSSTEPSENENSTKSPHYRSGKPIESILKNKAPPILEIHEKIDEQNIRLTRKSVRFNTPKEEPEKKRNTFDLENPATDINLLNKREENEVVKIISKQNVRKATPHIKRSIEHSFDGNLTKQQLLFSEDLEDDVFENEADVMCNKSPNKSELPNYQSAKLITNRQESLENETPSTISPVQFTDVITCVTIDKKSNAGKKIESFTPNKFGTKQNNNSLRNGILSRSTLDLTSKTPRKATTLVSIDKNSKSNKFVKSLAKKSDVFSKSMSDMNKINGKNVKLNKSLSSGLNSVKTKTRSSIIRELKDLEKPINPSSFVKNKLSELQRNSPHKSTNMKPFRKSSIVDKTSEIDGVVEPQINEFQNSKLNTTTSSKCSSSNKKGLNISQISHSSNEVRKSMIEETEVLQEIMKSNISKEPQAEEQDNSQRSDNLSIIDISSDASHFTLNESDKNLLMNNSERSIKKSLRRSSSAPSIPNAQNTVQPSLLREGTFSIEDGEGSIINLLDDTTRKSNQRSARKRWDKSMNMSSLDLINNVNLMDISPPKWSQSMNATKMDVFNTPGTESKSAKNKCTNFFASSTPFNALQKKESTKEKSTSSTLIKSDTKKSITKSKLSTRKKMPNFALIHQKAFDKMESIQQLNERKAVRAQQLLSGQKPQANISLKSNNKSPECRKPLKYTPNKIVKRAGIPVMKPSKKSPRRLEINISTTIEVVKPSTSNPKVKTTMLTSNNVVKLAQKKKVVTSNIPKPVLKMMDKPKEAKVLSKFGFKLNPMIPNQKKEDEVKAVASKSNILKSTTETRRNAVQNIRTNRRFELLMKMRNNKK